MNRWAIMRIDSIGSTLYWSEIPDGTPVINAVLSGELNESYTGNWADDYLMPDVYRLIDGQIEFVGEDLQRFIALEP